MLGAFFASPGEVATLVVQHLLRRAQQRVVVERGLAQRSRTAWYRKSRAKDQTALRVRIRELALARPRFGYVRIWVLLRREAGR